jgi:hypothetical protein
MPRKSTPKTSPYADDFIGPREPMFLTLIPFPGFYNTYLDGYIDHHQEQEAEYYADKEKGGYQVTEYSETLQPEHARISQDEFQELFFTTMDYGVLHRKLAHAYLDAFDHEASEHLNFPIGLRFESMDSPREYNFETDRLFANIPLRTARKLVRHVLRSKQSREHLRNNIERRHASYDGFASFYSTDTAEWAKRARDFMRRTTEREGDMDHNHFQTFLESAIFSSLPTNKHAWQNFLEDVHGTYSQDGIHQEWEESMDWDAFDKACQELRAEKDATYLTDNSSETLPPAPCPDTPDLFEGKQA